MANATLTGGPAKKAKARGASKGPRPWWGSGPPPHERWPGVSLDFKARYSTLRDRWETHDGAYYYDQVRGERAEHFFPLFLSHHIGDFAGLPFDLRPDQALLIVRPAFGWRKTSDGTRRFRKIFAFCPKGWGKSPLGAGIGLYLARYDGEGAPEVYAVAADKDQARIVHDSAKIMVENSPDLNAGSQIIKNSIVWPDLYAKFIVLSSDAETKHGFRPHGVIFDELHAQKNRDLFEALRKSMAKRNQPMMVIITHAGTDDEGICFEEYDLAKRILSGTAEELEGTLPVIFEMGKKANWMDPAEWKRVNPGHGVTVKHDDIVEECREAKLEPRKRNDFLRYHGNIWTNQATAWIPLDWWDDCIDPIEEDAILKTLPCAAGLDGAQKIDLFCFSVTFRTRLKTALPAEVVVGDESIGEGVKKTLDLNYRITVLPFFWIPEDTMEQHEKEDGVPYTAWAEAGLVTKTDGATIDYTRIFNDIKSKILPRFPRLKQGLVGYDPAFTTDIALDLRDRAGMKVKEILQNYSHMSEPCMVTEALIKAKRVAHGGHRVLRNHVENVAVKTDDAGRIRPVKPKKASKHIDGVVATLMGVRALAEVPDRKRSSGVMTI